MKTQSSQASLNYRMIVLVICWLGGVFSGMDANLFSVMLKPVISAIAGNLEQTGTLRLASFILSSFLFGWMAGGIMIGMANDRFGRVKMLAASIFLYASFTGLTSYAEHMATLAFCRFATGLGVGGTMVGITLFLSETWNTSSRSFAIALLITSYQVGVLLSGTLAHIFPDWRLAFSMGALPVLLSLCVLGYFREPPVRDVMHDAQTNDTTRKHMMLGAVIFGSLLIGYWASLTWVPTWMQDLRGSQSTGQEKTIATIIHGICAIAGCFLAGPLSDFMGRRPVIALSYTGALLTSLWMFLGHQSFTSLLYAYFGALGFFIGMAQAAMYIYLPELFPKKVRGKCVGICLNAGRLVTVIAVLFMGAMIQWFGGYVEALSAFSAIYIAGIGFVLLAPETKASDIPNLT